MSTGVTFLRVNQPLYNSTMMTKVTAKSQVHVDKRWQKQQNLFEVDALAAGIGASK